MGDKVTIRDATEDDIDFLAMNMHMAARSHLPRGLWEYIYDFDEQNTLTFLRVMAVTQPTHFCSFSLYRIAEVDGTPAAAMCGYDPATAGMGSMMQAIPVALEKADLLMDDFTPVLERGAVVGRVGPDTPDGMWVIENVACLPEFRRQGLVDRLLADALDRGREKGYRDAQIGVFLGNAPARNAYIKAGFQVVDEKRDAEFEAALGCAGIERLLQPLS